MPRRTRGKPVANRVISWYLRKGYGSKEFKVTTFDGVIAEYHTFDGESKAVEFAKRNGAKNPVVVQAAVPYR